MKALKIITLFLGCRLAWQWVDLCGADLGLGETLPFCIECSGMTSAMRLLLLGIAIWRVFRLLQDAPEYTQIYENYGPPAQTLRIHWHRIALLLVLATYSLWVWWVDKNTIIPGPDALWLTRTACHHPGFKGTMFWAIELTFVVWGFKILHRN